MTDPNLEALADAIRRFDAEPVENRARFHAEVLEPLRARVKNEASAETVEAFRAAHDALANAFRSLDSGAVPEADRRRFMDETIAPLQAQAGAGNDAIGFDFWFWVAVQLQQAANFAGTPSPNGPAARMAQRVIAGAQKKGNLPAHATVGAATDRLTERIEERLRELVRGLGVNPTTQPHDAAAKWIAAWREDSKRAGMLFLDAHLADLFEDLGPEGRKAAGTLRTNSSEAWGEWTKETPTLPLAIPSPADLPKVLRLWEHPLGVVETLAKLVWRDEVKPGLEREGRLIATAMPSGLLDRLTDAIFSTAREIVPAPSQLELFVVVRVDGRRVAHVERAAAEEMARRYECAVGDLDLISKVGATRKLLAHKLIRHLFHVGFRQEVVERVKQSNRYVFGGLGVLAERLGCAQGRDSKALREILDTLEAERLPLPHGGHDSLLAWSDRRAAPGRKPEAVIYLHDPLMPGYVHALPDKTESQRKARRLAPVPTHLPPLCGDRSTHAAQALLQMLVMDEFTQRAEELVPAEEGAPPRPLHIGRSRWRALDDRAGLPDSMLEEVLAAWETGSSTAPAFLARTGGWLFTLAPAYSKEQRLIVNTGLLHGRSSERSLEGQKKKARALEGRKASAKA